jgi:HEAT repeat protein
VAGEWLATGNRELRGRALEILGQLDAPEALAQLKKVARESSGQLRVQALAQMSRFAAGDPEVTAIMIDTLRAGRPNELHSAASALASAGTPEARRALVEALGAKSFQVRSAAAQVLGGVGGPEVHAALAVAARSGDRRVRPLALQALLESGAPEGLELAAAALDSPDAPMARAAAAALYATDGAEARGLLEAAITAGDATVRSLAVQALGERGDDDGVRTLVALSADADASVRSTALNGLAMSATPVALDALLDAARRGPAEQRAHVVGLLSNVDDPRAIELIRGAVSDATPEVASAALHAAAGTLGPEIDDAIAARLLDPRAPAEVRQAAAHALRLHGGEVAERHAREIRAQIGEEIPDETIAEGLVD